MDDARRYELHVYVRDEVYGPLELSIRGIWEERRRLLDGNRKRQELEGRIKRDMKLRRKEDRLLLQLSNGDLTEKAKLLLQRRIHDLEGELGERREPTSPPTTST